MRSSSPTIVSGFKNCSRNFLLSFPFPFRVERLVLVLLLTAIIKAWFVYPRTLLAAPLANIVSTSIFILFARRFLKIIYISLLSYLMSYWRYDSGHLYQASCPFQVHEILQPSGCQCYLNLKPRYSDLFSSYMIYLLLSLVHFTFYYFSFN